MRRSDVLVKVRVGATRTLGRRWNKAELIKNTHAARLRSFVRVLPFRRGPICIRRSKLVSHELESVRMPARSGTKVPLLSATGRHFSWLSISGFVSHFQGVSSFGKLPLPPLLLFINGARKLAVTRRIELTHTRRSICFAAQSQLNARRCQLAALERAHEMQSSSDA